MNVLLRILIVLVVASRVAAADGIVLESYTGERPADAPRLLAPVLEELSKRRFTAGEGVAREFEARVSRAALQPTGLPASFAADVDRGFKAWVGGRFDEAISGLGKLVATAHANSGAFAADPTLREPLQKALIALAIAQQRIGDQAAMRATFSELVRSFPEAQVPRGAYGPEAQQAFEQVRRELQGGGRGKLTVTLADESGVVFINEAYRAAGSTTAELIPGEYRVLVMSNGQPSRVHRVTLAVNAQVTVEIDPAWDHEVRTAGFTGLSFASQQDRDDREAPHAARFARLLGASAVAVVGIDEVHGRSAVVGVLVSLQSGREIRRASIPIEPDPSAERLRALARFLAGEDPEAGLDVQFANPFDRDIGNKPDAPGAPRWGGWRWITGALGVAGLATGGVLLGLDGRCSIDPPAGQPCNDVYATATPGFVTLGAGAVLTGISIYLFATHRSAQAPVVTPVQGGAGATVGFVTRW